MKATRIIFGLGVGIAAGVAVTFSTVTIKA